MVATKLRVPPVSRDQAFVIATGSARLVEGAGWGRGAGNVEAAVVAERGADDGGVVARPGVAADRAPLSLVEELEPALVRGAAVGEAGGAGDGARGLPQLGLALFGGLPLGHALGPEQLVRLPGHAAVANLGCGRIAISEIETPIILMNLL